MDLMAGKALMDQGINAEMLEELTGDIFPKSEEERARIGRSIMLKAIVNDESQPEERRLRAARGFANRKEERDAHKRVKAQVRRYHRIVDGQVFAKIADRRAKKKRANVARRNTRVCT